MSDDDEPDCPSCCCCSKETTDKLYIISVVFIMGFGYFSYWFLVVIPFRWWASFIGFTNLIFLHISFSLMCYSYLKAIVTCPGFVNVIWQPADASFEDLEFAKTENSQSSDRYFDPSTFYRPRWCKYCSSYKPPRAYHCRDLNRCILKLDHYCPWVYNAVGWKNHKFFFLFLFYASLSLFYHLTCVVIRGYYLVNEFNFNSDNFISAVELIIFGLQFILVLPITIAIFSLFLYQFSCMYEGQTSIEVMHCSRYTKYLKHRGYKLNWFYKFGAIDNIKLVLGNNILHWLVPNIPPQILKGNGTTFKTRVYPPLPPYEYNKENSGKKKEDEEQEGK